jgi:hypothetical protein
MSQVKRKDERKEGFERAKARALNRKKERS